MQRWGQLQWARWVQGVRKLLGLGRITNPGTRGERIAADWLRREKGFRIVARNWRSPRDRRDEIDLVGRDGEVLVFVEVKTRDAAALVPGYYAVDEAKKAVLRRAVRDYLAMLKGGAERAWRFDVVEVSVRKKAEAGGQKPEARGQKPGDGSRKPEGGKPEVEVLHFEGVQLFRGRRR